MPASIVEAASQPHAGHSLGGALATLAAYDIQAACDCRDKLDLSCYTFGAPRTGNHAFVHDYNDKVASVSLSRVLLTCLSLAVYPLSRRPKHSWKQLPRVLGP